MALSVWFNGSCPCQRLTGVGVTVTKRCYLFDCMFHGQIGIWNLPGFFIFIYDQICISDMC